MEAYGAAQSWKLDRIDCCPETEFKKLNEMHQLRKHRVTRERGKVNKLLGQPQYKPRDGLSRFQYILMVTKLLKQLDLHRIPVCCGQTLLSEICYLKEEFIPLQLLSDFHALDNKKNRQKSDDTYTLGQVSNYVLNHIKDCEENAQKFTHLRSRFGEAILLLNQITKSAETYNDFRSMIIDELRMYNFKDDCTVTVTDSDALAQNDFAQPPFPQFDLETPPRLDTPYPMHPNFDQMSVEKQQGMVME